MLKTQLKNLGIAQKIKLKNLGITQKIGLKNLGVTQKKKLNKDGNIQKMILNDGSHQYGEVSKLHSLVRMLKKLWMKLMLH